MKAAGARRLWSCESSSSLWTQIVVPSEARNLLALVAAKMLANHSCEKSTAFQCPNVTFKPSRVGIGWRLLGSFEDLPFGSACCATRATNARRSTGAYDALLGWKLLRGEVSQQPPASARTGQRIAGYPACRGSRIASSANRGRRGRRLAGGE